MLTQRIGKSANEFLTMEGVSPEAVFLLGKDLNTFKEIAEGLLNGSAELRLPGTPRPADARAPAALLAQYEQTRTEAGAILGNLQGLVAAREAQAAIVADSEPLRRGLDSCSRACGGRARLGGGAAGHGGLAALRFAIWPAARPAAPVRAGPDQRAARPPTRSAWRPSARSRKPSASTTPTRRPFCG
jgi:twitching motility protein PilJ